MANEARLKLIDTLEVLKEDCIRVINTTDSYWLRYERWEEYKRLDAWVKKLVRFLSTGEH